MRKIILNLAVTLDGLIEGPNGEYDWCMTDQDYGMTDFLNNTDTILFGRKSYELLISVQPDAYGKHTKYVFSKSLNQVQDGYTLIKGTLHESILKMKSEPGKNIWLFGGAMLTTSLIQERLVDELVISIHPLILGKGKPLFQNILERVPLELMDTIRYDGGLLQLYYKIKNVAV